MRITVHGTSAKIPLKLLVVMEIITKQAGVNISEHIEDE